ncbi:MAG: hypothetical protein JJU05_17240 [Verrucomicrobia bacterium]|nr:hypothetical protein [Verrucomicrobiota bacterium]
MDPNVDCFGGGGADLAGGMVVAVSPHPRRSRKRRAPPFERPALSMCRELVVVDSESIRRKALGDCSRARTTFHKAEAELAAYEAEDLPAFSRWYRVTFGPELEAIREKKEAAESLSQSIWRIQAYSQMAACSFADAARLLEENPNKFAKAEARIQEERRREEEERERHQERVNRKFVGEILPRLRRLLKSARHDIKRLRGEGWSGPEIVDALLSDFAFDEGLYARELIVMIQDPRVQALLRDYQLMPDQEPLEEEAREERADESEQGAGRRRKVKAAGKEQPEDARIKALKRELAFALHPDQDGGDDPQKLALWHQVQEAVAARDVDRLEVIQAHLHMLTGEVSPKTPVSRLQALTNMYRESRNALRRRIRKLRQSPEWGFRELGEKERVALRNRLRQEVLAERRRAESGLRNVQAEYRELKARSSRDPYGEQPSLLDLFDELDGFAFDWD